MPHNPYGTETGTVFRPYDTIDEAISAASPGDVVSVVAGTYSASVTVSKDITLETPVGAVIIGNDLTIQSGATLTLPEGTKLKFANGKKIVVNGTLNIEGLSGRRVSLTSSTGGNSWSGISFANGSDGLIEHADLQRLGGGAGSGAVTITETRRRPSSTRRSTSSRARTSLGSSQLALAPTTTRCSTGVPSEALQVLRCTPRGAEDTSRFTKPISYKLRRSQPSARKAQVSSELGSRQPSTTAKIWWKAEGFTQWLGDRQFWGVLGLKGR